MNETQTQLFWQMQNIMKPFRVASHALFYTAFSRSDVQQAVS